VGVLRGQSARGGAGMRSSWAAAGRMGYGGQWHWERAEWRWRGRGTALASVVIGLTSQQRQLTVQRSRWDSAGAGAYGWLGTSGRAGAIMGGACWARLVPLHVARRWRLRPAGDARGGGAAGCYARQTAAAAERSWTGQQRRVIRVDLSSAGHGVGAGGVGPLLSWDLKRCGR